MHIKKDYIPQNNNSLNDTPDRQLACNHRSSEKQADRLGSLDRDGVCNGNGDFECLSLNGRELEHSQNHGGEVSTLPGKRIEEKRIQRSYQAPQINRAPGPSLLGALSMVGLTFLLMPITQFLSSRTINQQEVGMNEFSMPPPDSLPPEPPPQDKEEELKNETPELVQEAELINLNQLEFALNPGVGDALGIGSALIGNFANVINIEDEMQIFEIRDLDQPPRAFVRVAPLYPMALRAKKIEGKVELLILIDQRGNVIRAKVQSSTNFEFDEAAVKAAMLWKFEPGMKNGEAVAVRANLPIVFSVTAT